MDKSASAIVGENVDAGVLLQTSPPRWYENITTGTELDFLMLLMLLPAIFLSWLFPRQHIKTDGIGTYEGRIYCVKTPTRLVFLSADSKWIATKLIAELASYPLSEITDIRFSHSHRTPVSFIFTEHSKMNFYFSGVWSDLASFKSKIVTDNAG